MSQNRRILLFIRTFSLASLLILSACATGTYSYTSLDSIGLAERTVTQIEGNVRVSAAVPGEEEVAAVLGVPIYKRGIQPVWLEIENNSPARIRFMPVGMDDDYFSPLEVAYMHKSGLSKQARNEMELRFYQLAMPRQIPPGETRSGFVFTHTSPGTKSFNVDVVSTQEDHAFSFFIDVPGFTPDHAKVDFKSLYDPSELKELDSPGFREMLASAEFCCTTDAKGERQGLPWNILLVGHGADLLQALIRANWYESAHQTGEDELDTAQYLFNRPPDAVFKNQRKGNRERNEMALWLSPVRLDGIPVWMAQITHFMGQKTRLEDFIFGARVDPDVDDSRNYLIQNLYYAQGLKKIAWVQTSHIVPIDESSESFDGTDYFTDGFRAVLWVSGDPISLLETQNSQWDQVPPR